MVLSSFVNGLQIDIGKEGFPLLRPKDELLIGNLLEAGSEGVDFAVHAAASAAREQARRPLHLRVAILDQAAAALEADAESVAALICEDIGKPVRVARIEVKRGIDFLCGGC